MIATITTTHTPATDLGYLLHKNPNHAQTFKLAFGKAYVVYPEASVERCSCALILDIDPVALVRRSGRSDSAGTLAQYVNDRPYVASSYLSVGIAQVFRTALSGRSLERPELAESPIPLEATIDVLPSRGGEDLIRRLFEPLGYTVSASQYPLDAEFPEWGDSSYFRLTITGTLRVADLLSHLYVLIPTLDTSKHYAIGSEEVEKLIRKGAGWLADHPEKELIASRYLRQKHSLIREALEQLTQDEESEEEVSEESITQDPVAERKVSLHTLRILGALAVLKESGAKRVLDLGCGEGKLIAHLLRDRQFTNILGMDVSYRSLETAFDKLRLERMSVMQRERITLIQGSLIYRDKRLEGYDAAAIVEVIEHLDPTRLAAFERVVFEFAHPKTVVVTTPNFEYNSKYETLPTGKFRHDDHRFEWSRAEFLDWSERAASRFDYKVRILPIGEVDETFGAPSQMAVFEVSG